MFGMKKNHDSDDESPEDYKNFLTEFKKTGFQKFIENQPEFDLGEKARDFLEKQFGMTVPKIIGDVESAYYPKDTKYVTKVYYVDTDSQSYRHYNSYLSFGKKTIMIDEDYPVYVFFYQNQDDDDLYGVYAAVTVGDLPQSRVQ